MATRQLNIYADIDSGRLITSASSTLQATLPRFTYRDTIPVSFRALTASGSPSAPWRDADLTGQSVRIAIGNPSARPLSGSFAMTYDGDTTTAIQWDASATDVASALNILDSVISAGGVAVSKQTAGIYRIAFLTVGVKEDFLTDSGPLVPSGSMITNRVVTGDATTKEIVALSFEALPAAYADLSDPLPSAAATITTVRVGSGSAGEIRTIEFPVIPFGGTYSLAVNGNSTTGLAWDASAEDVAYALQYLAGMAGNVTVTGAFPFFTVNFALSVGALTSMTADPSGLVVPIGRMGTISTATSEFLDMLAGSSLASAKFEIELHDIATGEAWTIIQADCQVARDIISESPVVPALRPTPEDWLSARIIQPITSSLTIDPGTSALTIGPDHWGKKLQISAPLDITFPTPDTGQAGRRVALYLYGSASVTLTNAGFSGVLTTGDYIAECIVSDWYVQRAAMDNVQVVSAAFFASLTTEQQAAGTYFIYDA